MHPTINRMYPNTVSTARNALLQSTSDQNRLLRATHGTTIIHKSAGLVQYSDPKVVESRDNVS